MELQYLTVAQAAKMIGVHIQAIYKGIYRKKLKHVKQKILTEDGTYKWQMFTTKQWLKEWEEIKQNRNYLRQNGKLVFQPKEGKYSASQAQEMLGFSRNQFNYYRISGQLKAVKVGYYYMYEREDIEALKQKLEEKAKILKTG